jgi:hypothetical protein
MAAPNSSYEFTKKKQLFIAFRYNRPSNLKFVVSKTNLFYLKYKFYRPFDSAARVGGIFRLHSIGTPVMGPVCPYVKRNHSCTLALLIPSDY